MFILFYLSYNLLLFQQVKLNFYRTGSSWLFNYFFKGFI